VVPGRVPSHDEKHPSDPQDSSGRLTLAWLFQKGGDQGQEQPGLAQGEGAGGLAA
jgi:hypothetical protein